MKRLITVFSKDKSINGPQCHDAMTHWVFALSLSDSQSSKVYLSTGFEGVGREHSPFT